MEKHYSFRNTLKYIISFDALINVLVRKNDKIDQI